MHTSWIEHKFRILQRLYKAGCDVPIPYARGHNAILVSFIGNERIAAPTPNGIKLNKKLAQTLFERTIENIHLMLTNQRVHGDLSAYNILYWEGSITLIDFPQAIDPACNPNAYPIFQRDVIHICEYFQRQGIQNKPPEPAEELWVSHGYSTSPHFLPIEEEESLKE